MFFFLMFSVGPHLGYESVSLSHGHQAQGVRNFSDLVPKKFPLLTVPRPCPLPSVL
jgi:hypothetical protein